MTDELMNSYEGLRNAYLATGASDEKAHDLAIRTMANHEPTVALARAIVANASDKGAQL